MPIAKAGRIIETLEDWERQAPPKSQHQWVDGRSAKEAARAWLEQGGGAMPQEVHEALRRHPRFGLVRRWDAEPEARLRFDAFAGEPRNTDLLVIATDDTGPYLLAVEAKADEPYGERVGETFAAALERRIDKPRSKGIARIEGLATLLLRPRLAGQPKARDLRYQLLTACAGALAEAQRRQLTRAVMLIHELITPATADHNHARNAADLQAFLERLTGRRGLRVQDGELQGPFVFPEYGSIELFLGKVSRNLRGRDI